MSTYVRSAHTWRRPMVHIVWDQTGSTFVPLCRSSAYSLPDADVYDSLPEGMDVCRLCAERQAVREERRAQRHAPDPAAYRNRTDDLLERAA